MSTTKGKKLRNVTLPIDLLKKVDRELLLKQLETQEKQYFNRLIEYLLIIWLECRGDIQLTRERIKKGMSR